MTKVRSILLLSLILCLAAVSVSACGKVKALTENGSAAATQTPASSVAPTATAAPTDSPCAKVVEASPSAHKAATTNSWTSPPAMSIDVNKTYCAVVQTSKGSFTLELFAKDAPKTVNNFVFLARNNYYNGIIFHRIIENFMIQSGDPTGTGSGSPGYQFEDELTGPHKYVEGIVAMANGGPDHPNTNGSQFFINTADNTQNLTNNYSIFAQVAAGMDTVKKIAATPVTANPRGEKSVPTEKVTIDSVTVVEL